METVEHATCTNPEKSTVVCCGGQNQALEILARQVGLAIASQAIRNPSLIKELQK